MAAKKKTPEELLADLGMDDDTEQAPSKSGAAPAADDEDDENDVAAQLLKEINDRPNSTRPDTPLVASSAASVGKPTPTTSTGSGRSSEEKAGGDQKIVKAPAPPASQSQQQDAAAAASSWWGGLSAMANSALKQAEAAYKEIQKNEEAQKWAESVKGNVGALRDIGGDLRSRINFTSLLHTLAPPISQHERLQIHIAHDLVGYPPLDPLIYNTFSRVMAQVEGGDLLVIQRGSEFTGRGRAISEVGYRGGISGWGEGPWFLQNDAARDVNSVKGLPEGTKLARATAESYAQDYFKAHGGIEEAARAATADVSESNPVRRSDIFLTVQAIEHEADPAHFAGNSASTADAAKSDKPAGGITVVDEATPAVAANALVSFAFYLHDPVHSITFAALSQAIPAQWIAWLSARSTSATHDGTAFVPRLPDEIAEIVDAGGVDPREWASEWLEETLSLAAGCVAQRYVARRMGVGEAGLGRGRSRVTAAESGGGEAARAI